MAVHTVHLPSGEKTKFSEGIIIKPIEYIRGEPSDREITFEQIQDRNAKLCFFYKKRTHSDEREIRILRCEGEHKKELYPSVILKSEKDDLPRPNTYHLKITSASDLIEQIVISPFAHSEFRRMLEDHIEIYNFYRKSEKRPLIDCKITESELKSWM